MIRVRTDLLSPGSLPVYDFPQPWPHDVFIVNEEGKAILKIQKNKKRVTIPLFEIGALSPDPEKAKHLLRLKVSHFLAQFCIAMSFRDGVAVMPSRGIMVVGGSGPNLNAYVQIGMLITADYDPQEGDINPDESLMLPRSIESAEELERHAGDLIDMHEVMES